MAGEGIPLTVCPWSNVVIANRYASLGDHPLAELRDAGVLLTINTDDPAMMRWDLGREYAAVGSAHGFDVDTLATVAFEGIDSTWLDDTARRALRAQFRAAIDDVPPAAATPIA